ncbi:MAG: tetratricopeptide repeat protein [Planctomycetota bacterium]
MAKIRIHCSECGHEARVPEAFRGKKVRCLRCHAKLRVPEDAPYVEPRKKGSKSERAPEAQPRARKSRKKEPTARRGGPNSRTRREAMGVLRELLHDYDHALEDVPRGFDVDLRGVSWGLARTLVEELLECEAISDVKLAGGTGEVKMIVSLKGYAFDPEDSFADDDEETEIFQRGPTQSFEPHGLVEGQNLDMDEADDPTRDLMDHPTVPQESSMNSMFAHGSGRSETNPIELYERAREHVEEGEPAAAIPLLEKAVRSDKNFARAVLLLGKTYASVGDYHRARRAFRHLSKLESDDPEAFVLYAAAAVRCERLEEARTALKAAIKVDSEYARAYRYAAQLYERLGDAERARKFRAKYQTLKLRG